MCGLGEGMTFKAKWETFCTSVADELTGQGFTAAIEPHPLGKVVRLGRDGKEVETTLTPYSCFDTTPAELAGRIARQFPA